MPSNFSHSVAIFCRNLDENGDPFSKDYYWQAYQDLMLALKARGVETYLVTDNNTYLGFGKFSAGYTINSKTTLGALIKIEDISVNLVFDRGGFIGRDVNTINSSYLMKICNNKIEMYKHFSKFQPLSFICQDKTEVIEAFKEFDSEMIVAKEPESEGGRHVYIGTKEDVLEKLTGSYPLLVQEFLDTSIGFGDLAKGVHDIRLSMCGGELIGCYVRQAEAGSLHSNVSQGGQMVFMDVQNAPSEPVAIAQEIDQLFRQYPRYYSVDFINTTKGWKMLETNPILALLPISEGPEAQKTLDRLADYLASVAQHGATTHSTYDYGLVVAKWIA